MAGVRRASTMAIALFVVAASLLVPGAAFAANANPSMTTCSGTFCFQPATINVPVGGTAAWHNTTTELHTATADAGTGTWTTGTVNAGATSADITFPTAGVFPYHCDIHPYMHGTVLVGVTAQIVLPSVVNHAYGGYTTVAYVNNDNYGPASVHIRYFDQTGAAVAGVDNANLHGKATWTVRQDDGSLPSGFAGSAIIYSDQAVAAFVNEFAPGGGDASSYTGIPIGSETGDVLHAPAIANNAYGGYTTGLGIVNVGDVTADLTIRYRDQNGAVVATQTLTGIPPHAYRDAYSGAPGLLPDGFAGTATMTDNAPGYGFAAIVNETGPNGQFSSYDAIFAGTSILHAPVMLNGGFGGYFTGIGVRNITSSDGTVTVTYYDSAGNVAKTVTQPIKGNGYLPIYQGDAAVGPPPSDSGYSATLTTSVSIAAIVNEVAPPSGGVVKQSTSYNMSRGGPYVLHAALVENAGSDGWTTGMGIMNTSAVGANVTIQYFDASTGAALTTKTITLLAGHAFHGEYTGDDLPAGTRASVTLVSAPTSPIAVIVNEVNASSFMSYDGQ